MFYSTELLSLKNRGKFSICWIAATLRTNSPLTKTDIMSVNIETLCENILEYIMSNSGHPKKRMSLYLSAQLLYGTCIIFHKQVDYFQDSVFLYYRHAYHVKKDKKKKTEEIEFSVTTKEIKIRKKKAQKSAEDEALRLRDEMLVPNISEAQENLLVEPVPQIMPNISAITIPDDVAPITTIRPHEETFGDEDDTIIQQLAIFDELKEIDSHPTLIVTADIHPHPVPTETNLTDTRIPEIIQSSEQRIPEKKTPSSAKKRRRNAEAADDIEKEHTPKMRIVTWKDEVSHVNLMSPRGKSTPLPEHEKRASSKKDDGEMILETIDEDNQLRTRERRRRRRRLDFDDERIIPSNKLIAQITPNIHTFEKVPIVDIHANLSTDILFTKPAKITMKVPPKIVIAEILLQQFSWKTSNRQHSFDIINEFSKHTSILRNITAEESLPSRIDLTPIQPIQPLEHHQTTLPSQEIQQIPPDEDIQLTKTRQDATLPDEQTVVQFPSSVRDVTTEQSVPEISTMNEISRGVDVEEPEQMLSKFDKVSKTKAEVLANLKEYWNQGQDEILFSTLCPIPGTNRRTAALTFNFLIELHRKKYVTLTNKPNSLEIYSIKRRYK